jgi:hypothetical protein
LHSQGFARDPNLIDDFDMRWRRGVPENSEAGAVRKSLFQYLKPLRGKLRKNHRDAGDVSAGVRKAGYMPRANRIGMLSKHNRDSLGCFSGGFYLRRHGRNDDIDVLPDQIVRQPGQFADAICPSEIKDNILAFDVPHVAQTCPQCIHFAGPR